MKVKGKIVVVTGAASGIGKAMIERFAAEGAAGLVAADLNAEGAEDVALSVGGMGVATDVSNPAQVEALVRAAQERFGRIDLFCSNAGVSVRDADLENAVSTPDDGWALGWSVNVMAHVYAARACLPGMIARGEGYFLNTVSAAGLLSQIGSAIYSTTKHAAVGFAEWLAITYGDDGIKVSCLCPQGVNTNMVRQAAATSAGGVVIAEGLIEPEAVADAVIAGLAEERFLILPHPEVHEYVQRKAADPDRWLGGMRKLQRRIRDSLG
jgi:NAD(P)-dependent dehydrogenase (short-subunit alcohol dehydrogenase family)